MQLLSANRGRKSQVASSLGAGDQFTQAPRALIVSHPCVVPANQSVFAVLAELGWRLDLVVPSSWRHDYAEAPVHPTKLPELKAGFYPRRVFLAGQPQRHFYCPGPSRVLRRLAPDVAFLEEETFSIPALQWGLACWRAGIPFGVQADENLDRSLPLPARVWRSWTLQHAAFVAARSPTAKRLVERWGARGRVEVIPHAVPSWPLSPIQPRSGAFTIGYAGRLVPEKGLFDLVAAAKKLSDPVRLLLAGNGPLRAELAAAAGEGVAVEVATDIKHEEMARAFGAMDVLVLPSHTTSTWAEQFGRVLVEALWCGVPVIGSSSGEIPWVIGATGGGLVFPEGDVAALTAALEELKASPGERSRLAAQGREAVERQFSVAAAASALAETLAAAVGAPQRLVTPRP